MNKDEAIKEAQRLDQTERGIVATNRLAYAMERLAYAQEAQAKVVDKIFVPKPEKEATK